jgi:hypothetical protein
MALADFLADRNDDALPSDHGSETERDRERDFDPGPDDHVAANPLARPANGRPTKSG